MANRQFLFAALTMVAVPAIVSSIHANDDFLRRIPKPGDIREIVVQPDYNFVAADFDTSNYKGLTVGEPWKLAQSIRNWFNGLTENPPQGSFASALSNPRVSVHDDVQVIAVGATCTSSDDVVVGPGPNYRTEQRIPTGGTNTITIGPPMLTTVPASGDVYGTDPSGNRAIVCGQDLVAGTEARNGVAVQLNQQGRLRVQSAWRNPERNEAVGGVINSRHQFGGAIDVQVEGDIVLEDDRRITASEFYCLLEHTSERMLELAYGAEQAFARQWAISELGGTPTQCDGSRTIVSHVHVQTD